MPRLGTGSVQSYLDAQVTITKWDLRLWPHSVQSRIDAKIMTLLSYTAQMRSVPGCSGSVPRHFICLLSDVPGQDSISNLKLWLKADAITGRLEAAAVANWSDMSGNGFTLSKATGASQPIYKTNQINGMPILRFNGTSAFLQGGFTGSIASKTMLAIVKLATLAPTGTASAAWPVTVQSSNDSIFDTIIYNEITAKRWMNGSDGLNRSPYLVSPTD
jgi:hypothetical protein